MDILAGGTVVFIGRLSKTTRAEAAEAVAARGGRVRQGLTRQTTHLVVGGGQPRIADDGSLATKLAAADVRGAETMGEAAFLRAAGLAPPLTGHEVPAQILAERSGLSTGTLRVLALFDVVSIERGLCRFADLGNAQEAGRLLGGGATIGEIITAFNALRRAGLPNRRVPLVVGDDGAVRLRVGEAEADLDGQFRLPLGDGGNPSADRLFEAAEAAERSADFSGAESLYRRAWRADPRDPTIPFNLANVLRERGRLGDAAMILRLALALDPHFPEAWYNLGDMEERLGCRAAARAALEHAVGLDAGYGDALFNLGLLLIGEGDCARALPLFERCVEAVPAGAERRRAGRLAAYCRRMAAEVDGAFAGET